MGDQLDASRAIAGVGGESDEDFPWLTDRVMFVLGIVGGVLVGADTAAADDVCDCAV